MPGGYPFGIECCNAQDVGTISSGSVGTSVTCGTANVKGGWTQLISSLGADCCWTVVELACLSLAKSVLVDIGIGSLNNEQPVVNNLWFRSPAGVGSIDVVKYCFPLQIPSGSRISVRGQSNTAAQVFTAKMSCYDGAFTMMEGAARIDMVGVSTATSSGTAVMPNATANTKGSFAQLILSTTKDYCGLIVVVGLIGTVSTDYLFDIAIGGAGSEQVIIPNIHGMPQTSAPMMTVFVPIPVPSGSRLSARAQANGASAANCQIAAGGIYI
jgi:hypothetical protein